MQSCCELAWVALKERRKKNDLLDKETGYYGTLHTFPISVIYFMHIAEALTVLLSSSTATS